MKRSIVKLKVYMYYVAIVTVCEEPVFHLFLAVVW
jgi:hypothetical protein